MRLSSAKQNSTVFWLNWSLKLYFFMVTYKLAHNSVSINPNYTQENTKAKLKCSSIKSTGKLELCGKVTSIWYFSVASSQLLHFIICNPLLSSVPAATVILTLLHLWLYCEFLSPMGKWTLFFFSHQQLCCTCLGKKKKEQSKSNPRKRRI